MPGYLPSKGRHPIVRPHNEQVVMIQPFRVGWLASTHESWLLARQGQAAFALLGELGPRRALVFFFATPRSLGRHF